ncbi:MAG: hypothetical protein KAQ65_07790 [Candidatus Thorarchaeota archaeon]|nr:hypothetical protein [Candidatus Thorarchaeota archaeon]
MDYLGFYIRDDEGHQWCYDLFEHYWKQGFSI